MPLSKYSILEGLLLSLWCETSFSVSSLNNPDKQS